TRDPHRPAADSSYEPEALSCRREPRAAVRQTLRREHAYDRQRKQVSGFSEPDIGGGVQEGEGEESRGGGLRVVRRTTPAVTEQDHRERPNQRRPEGERPDQARVEK